MLTTRAHVLSVHQSKPLEKIESLMGTWTTLELHSGHSVQVMYSISNQRHTSSTITSYSKVRFVMYRHANFGHAHTIDTSLVYMARHYSLILENP